MKIKIYDRMIERMFDEKIGFLELGSYAMLVMITYPLFILYIRYKLKVVRK